MRPTGDIHGRAAETGIQSERYKGTVTEATRELCSYATTDNPRTCLRVKVAMKQGPDKGTIIDLGEAGQMPADDPFAPKLEAGDGIILGYEPANDVYFYTDRDRADHAVRARRAVRANVVIALGRWRGVTALIALGASVAVLLQFIVPSVLDGRSPLLVAIVGSSAVAFIALYLSTGFNTMTTVALLGTLAALALTAILGWAFFAASKFTGAVSEEASYLRLVTDVVDVRGTVARRRGHRRARRARRHDGHASIGSVGAAARQSRTDVAVSSTSPRCASAVTMSVPP